MKRSILRGHVSPAFSRKLRGIGSRRHDASQKRLWKINVLPARAFVRSLSPFFRFLFVFFLSTRKRIYIVLLNNVFRSRKEDRTDEYLFLFFTNGKESYIIFVYTSLYESFDFEKRGRNGLTNIVDRYYYYYYSTTRRFHSDDRVGGGAGKRGLRAIMETRFRASLKDRLRVV